MPYTYYTNQYVQNQLRGRIKKPAETTGMLYKMLLQYAAKETTIQQQC